LDGKNMLLQAQSGHGKTAIFATAILNNIDTSEEEGAKGGLSGREGGRREGLRGREGRRPLS
jgi:superfamily II DNA/RNA helicase